MFKISNYTLEKFRALFKLQSNSTLGISTLKMIDPSFWAIVVLFLNKTNHYFNVLTNKNICVARDFEYHLKTDKKPALLT